MLLQTWLIVFGVYLVILYMVEAFCLYLMLNVVRWNGRITVEDMLSPDEMVNSNRGDVYITSKNLSSFLWMCATMILAFFNSLLGLVTLKTLFRPMARFRSMLWITVPISFIPLFPLHLLDQDLFEWINVIVTVFVASSTMLTISLAIFVGLIEKEFHEKTTKKDWSFWNVLFDT
ncbi:unnamed protein product [Bursaphelenchus xylophilus]|uniref:(pine wood nematode) hypothetical protein n=1 Tax=Bursaphelenchus xylophilus TaxID=6326 RepID=A0A1I7SBB2_BURXY|nr:unnamed protein product [Bursaphelenchus xylophilus]CAG9131982.1 unnamed protein product [Bursaphelenchus xylophilus]